MKKMQKKSKKKLRGMTLVEIIVALAVFAMLGTILVLAALSIDKHSRSARHLNDKVAVQGPIAEAQNTDGSVLIDDDFEIKVNSNITVKGKLYDTADYEQATDGTFVKATDDSETADLNLKYIAGIQMPTEAATSASP